MWEEGGSGGVRMTERWVSARPPTCRDTPQEPGRMHSTNSCSCRSGVSAEMQPRKMGTESI